MDWWFINGHRPIQSGLEGKNWVKVSQVSVQIEDFFHKGERTNQDKNNQTRRTSWDEPQAPKEGHSQKILLRENQVWYKQFLAWDNNWR